MIKNITLSTIIGLEGSKNAINIEYIPTGFTAYNVRIVVEYMEKEIK